MRKDVKEKVPTMMPNKSLDIHRKTGFLNIQSLHQRINIVKIVLYISRARKLKTNDSPSLLYSKTNLDV